VSHLPDTASGERREQSLLRLISKLEATLNQAEDAIGEADLDGPLHLLQKVHAA